MVVLCHHCLLAVRIKSTCNGFSLMIMFLDHLGQRLTRCAYSTSITSVHTLFVVCPFLL